MSNQSQPEEIKSHWKSDFQLKVHLNPIRFCQTFSIKVCIYIYIFIKMLKEEKEKKKEIYKRGWINKQTTGTFKQNNPWIY